MVTSGRGSRNDSRELRALDAAIVACRRCPRLRSYCRQVAKAKRRAYADWAYWGRPVPGFGDPSARVLVVGLAPGAHGANRTGRMFTGDGAGSTLVAALHRARFASRPASVARDDGLVLSDLYLTAALRCAPPANKPLPIEVARCRPYLVEELRLLRRVRVVVALGRLAHEALLAAVETAEGTVPRPRPAFRHGAEYALVLGHRPLWLVDSYHPSRQNTQTGRLTPIMIDAVFARVRDLLS